MLVDSANAIDRFRIAASISLRHLRIDCIIMYKHVAKQRRLVNSNKELHLSDEDSSGNSSSSDGGRSDSGSDSDSDDSGEGEDDDDILGGLGGKEEDAGEEEEEDSDDEEILPPPAGFPTALEATINPIGEPEDDDEEDGTLKEEGVPVCAVCPNKALKKGKMLELHLKSKVSFFFLLAIPHILVGEG